MKAPDVVLSCDHTGCLAIPTLAPRIFVPAGELWKQEHEKLTLAFPHLHYCDAHWETDVALDRLMTSKIRARFEDLAKKLWPHGVKPNFNAALIEPIRIWTPEYAAYMARLGFRTDGLGFSMHRPVLHPRMAR